MRGRTARRLALMRYERRLTKHHPESVAPPCLIRAYNRWVDREVRKVVWGSRRWRHGSGRFDEPCRRG